MAIFLLKNGKNRFFHVTKIFLDIFNIFYSCWVDTYLFFMRNEKSVMTSGNDNFLSRRYTFQPTFFAPLSKKK